MANLNSATDCFFDMELFIAEIQAEPAVWNYTSDSYKNRAEKIKAWDKICMKLYPNFMEMADKEKNDTVTLLQRKWKSLRDSYNRELNKLKKVKSVDDAFSKRKYIYFDQLSFLQPLAEQRITLGQHEEKDSIKEEMVDSISDQVEAEAAEEAPASGKRSKRSPVQAEGGEPRRWCKRRRRRSPEGGTRRDEDTLFCLSLVNDLKRVPDLLRADAKCELLQVLKRYKIAGGPLYPGYAAAQPLHPAYTDTSLLRLAKVEMGPHQGAKKRPNRTKGPPTSPDSSSSDSFYQLVDA